MTASRQAHRYSKEEIAVNGKRLYESQIRVQVEKGDAHGKVVAIDVETGDFRVAKDSLTASDALLDDYPNAQVWLERIGCKAVHRIGAANSTS